MTATLIAAPPAPPAPPAPATPVPPGALPSRPVLRIPPSRGADRVRALARRAGFACEPDHEHGHGPAGPGSVSVVVAADAEQALRCGRDPGRLLLVCDTVSRRGLLLALRTGAVVLRTADLTEETLAAAVRRAAHPHPSIPYPELSHLLTTARGSGEPVPDVRPPALTARQMSVLRLLAEGHANAGIARLLDCSEHTVKNVIYEIMARLQARNRAHAVAQAVRHGLV
ncbi:response regulator transcription factor [Streptomyces sp. NPDC005551]|uniref:response regulator transcription factor n=1 Tax=Streptomyces sp. NPDC005551 TaxID=3364725 RepID=UPI0036C876B5